MLTLFPRIRANPVAPPPAVPEPSKQETAVAPISQNSSVESSSAAEAQVATCAEAPIPLVVETVHELSEPSAPVAVVKEPARVEPELAGGSSMIDSEAVDEQGSAPEPFVVEISCLKPTEEVGVRSASATADLDGQSAAEATAAAAVEAETPVAEAVSEASASQEAPPAGDAPAGNAQASASNEAAQSEHIVSNDPSGLVVAGANIFDEMEILHEAAAEAVSLNGEQSLSASSPEAMSPESESVSAEVPTAAISRLSDGGPIQEAGVQARVAETFVGTRALVAETASREEQATENGVVSAGPLAEQASAAPIEAPIVTSPAGEAAEIAEQPLEPGESAVGGQVEAVQDASQIAVEHVLPLEKAVDQSSTVAPEVQDEAQTEEVSAQTAQAVAEATAESPIPEAAAEAAFEVMPREVGALTSDQKCETVGAQAESAPGVAVQEPCLKASSKPAMPTKPKRAKESFFALERVPEPEAMDDSDQVEAYASAAAQAHLDAIDDTFVAHAQLLIRGRERGRALDIGTGPGQIVVKLASRLTRWKFIGVDRSPAMIEKARASLATTAEVAGRVEFQVADGNGLAFPDASFDLVVCNSVLHHLAEPQKLFSEMARLVRPGGAILLRDLRRPARFEYGAHIRKNAKRYSGEMKRLYIASVQAAYTEQELQKMVSESALRNVHLFRHGKTHIGFERALTAAGPA
jgi:ubiquinone/menaquinone biosynthesis C-methylase UbiE